MGAALWFKLTRGSVLYGSDLPEGSLVHLTSAATVVLIVAICSALRPRRQVFAF